MTFDNLSFFIDTNSTTINLMQPIISNSCFNWCKDAYFINNNNLEIEMLFLPALALLSLILYQIFKDHNKLSIYAYKFIYAAKYLLIGFFIYFFWKYYF